MKKALSLKKTIIFIIIVICSVALIKQQFAMSRVKAQIEENQKELELVQKQNAKLKSELDDAKNQTDEYLERLARERLGMIKPDEQVIGFSDSDAQENSQ